MPTHVTESTGASITAQWEFTTGTLIVSPTATIKADVISETTAGAGVTIDSVLLKDGAVTLSTGVSLPIASGGTGATTVAGARTSLGAAASGTNSDITRLTGLTTPITVAQGGTSLTTVASNSLLYGNGTSALQVLATGVSGAQLTSNATGVPVWLPAREFVGVICAAPSTSLTATTDLARFQFPFSGYIAQAEAGVSTAPTGTTFNADVWVNSSTIFSNVLKLNAGETSTRTSASPPVIATATSAFSAWDTCRVHLNSTGNGTAGLWVTLVCVRKD